VHPTTGIIAEYEESQCTLYNDRGQPDGIDTLVRQQNAWHFNEVCLSCKLKHWMLFFSGLHPCVHISFWFNLTCLLADFFPLANTHPIHRQTMSANKLSTDCPNRLYVFERIPSYRFEGINDKELTANNRTECEDNCLSAVDLPCRSATYDRTTNKCRLSRETRYMNPRGFKSDPNSDYLENMCLKRKLQLTIDLTLFSIQ